jgi:Type IV secretory system Conjugative DNA transfer
MSAERYLLDALNAGMANAACGVFLIDLDITGLVDANGGVYVGAWPEKRDTLYLRHDGPQHVLAFAPSRSGKGVGLVLPTLLSWPSSVVVNDIKGENWALTAGWRRDRQVLHRALSQLRRQRRRQALRAPPHHGRRHGHRRPLDAPSWS